MGTDRKEQVIGSARFGEIAVEEDKVITFPGGLFGFEELTRFVLFEHEEADGPFRWLHSVEDGAVAFLVMDIVSLLPDYRPQIDDDLQDWLQLEPGDDLVVLNILRVYSGGEQVTANLRAPVLIAAGNRRGVQVILEDESLPTRFPLIGPPEKQKGNAHAGT